MVIFSNPIKNIFYLFAVPYYAYIRAQSSQFCLTKGYTNQCSSQPFWAVDYQGQTEKMVGAGNFFDFFDRKLEFLDRNLEFLDGKLDFLDR